MDDPKKTPEEAWPQEIPTKGDIPSLQKKSVEWVMEIRGAGDILLRHQPENAENQITEQKIGDLNEALDLLKGSQITADRTRIQLVLCMQEPYSSEPFIQFLEALEDMPEKPHTVLSGCSTAQRIEELVDSIQPTPAAEIVSSAPPDSSDFSVQGNEKVIRIEVESYESAKLSPLPALRLEKYREMTHDPDLTRQKKLDDVHVVCVMDFDGSVYQNEPEYGIVNLDFMHYVRAYNSEGFRKGQGNLPNLEQAIKFCEKWAEQRKKRSQDLRVEDPIEYQKGIIISDNRSAAGFEGMYIDQLQEMANEFVDKFLRGRFFEHTQPVLQVLRDYGVLPVLVTGAPHVLVPPLLKQAGMTHGNGLRYEMDQDNKLTGRVEHYWLGDNEIEYHMGISRGKARLCQDIVLKGYGIGESFGDSPGDLGLFGCSIRRMTGKKWDWDGGAVLVNGNADAEEDVEKNYSNEVDGERFEVLRPGTPARKVVNAVESTLQSVFVASMENLENIKRMRDILTKLGYPDEEKREIMLEFYSEEIVDAAIKDHNLNTKNENDLVRYYKKIGMPEEFIQTALIKNREHYQKRKVTVIPLKKRSSYPPSIEPGELSEADGDQKPG